MKAMPMDLLRRMTDQAPKLQVPKLCTNGFCEICLIPMVQLWQYLGYIAAQPRRFKVLIYANGNRMDQDRSALFIEHKVYLVNATIDGATREMAESIRKHLKFDQIEANIKRLIGMWDAAGKRYPKVRMGMAKMPQTPPEIGPFPARWKSIADYVGIDAFSSHLASVAEEPGEPPMADRDGLSSPGPQAWAFALRSHDMDIWADGKAVLGCEDWNEESVVGDLNTHTLGEIWQDPLMMDVQRKHVARLGHEVALCAKCNNSQPASTCAKTWA